MIKNKSERKGPIKIDLTGPEGNAFVLIGYAGKWANQLGLDSKSIQEEMMEGDYDNLLSVMEKYFGEHIIMYR